MTAATRPISASDDMEVLVEFAAWLETQGIPYQHDAAAFEDGEFTVWTDWITDKGKAALLKLTWGGAI
jgi:hypothetical protein